MRSTRSLGATLLAWGWLSLSSCSSSGVDGSVGPMGLPGPPGPVGPMGSSGGGVYDELILPGPAYFPESLTSSADGTLYVGSVGSTTIVKFAPGSNTAVPLVTQTAPGKNIAGVFVDEPDKSLLACVDDATAIGTFKPVLKRFSLADGSEKASYPFPAAGICSDMTLDGKHNLYVTDSFGKIYQLADGAQALTEWAADPLFITAVPGSFGADGIAWDTQNNLYVANFGDSLLLRVPIDPVTGKAGTVTMLSVTPALTNPDAVRTLDATTLVVVEGAGRLTRLKISGNTATGVYLSNRLDEPTSVTRVGSNYYVTEGQLSHFLAMPMTQPRVPFLVRRVPNF